MTDQKTCHYNTRIKWHRWITAVWDGGKAGCTVCLTCLKLARKKKT